MRKKLMPVYDPRLKTFLAVCDRGSFSAAAEGLFLTPSAVLHQIRALEKDLGTELFQRTSKGVSLTPAGSLLEARGRSYMHLGDEIRRDVRDLASRDNRICIGTSMLEKCRLLYDLWVLFSEEAPGYTIQMTNIASDHEISDNTDLIESLNSNVSWMRNWNFFEICKVPFGCAFVRSHPLAQKAVITAGDLRGETVRSINDGSCETISALLKHLRDHGVKVVVQYSSGMNMFWESAFQGDVQLVPLCFQDILINMTVVPLEPVFALPYGIFYRSNPTAAARKFMDFIRKTYEEGNSAGIVPILG